MLCQGLVGTVELAASTSLGRALANLAQMEHFEQISSTCCVKPGHVWNRLMKACVKAVDLWWECAARSIAPRAASGVTILQRSRIIKC